MPTAHKSTFFAALAPTRVDVEGGRIEGLCLMKAGPALGHGQAVDQTTLDQLVAESAKLKKASFVVQHDGHPLHVIGDLSNFRRDGDTARADLDVYKNYPDREQFLEIADRNPSAFGVSAEFKNTPETIGTAKFARVSAVRRFALERDPAAAPNGLFSEATQPDTLESMTPEELTAAITAAIKPVADKVTALESMFAEKKEPEGDDAPITKKDLKTAAEAAGLEALTKFAAQIGLKKPPVNNGAGEGEPEGGDDVTKFSTKVKTIMGTGVDKNTAVRAARKADEKGFEAFCKAGSKLR